MSGFQWSSVTSFSGFILASASSLVLASTISPFSIIIPPALIISQGMGSITALTWVSIASFSWPDPAFTINNNLFFILLVFSSVVSLLGGRIRSRAQLLQLSILVPIGALFSQWIFIGKDKIGGFLEKGLVEAAGVFDSINDLQPDFSQLAGQAGALAQGLGDQLPAMQQQLEQFKPQIEGLAGELESFATSDAVTGLGESLQGSVSSIQSALQENSGAFANLGQGLQQINIPSGY